MTAADLTCGGCGCVGRRSTIVWDRSQEDPLPVLQIVLGWHPDGRPALLCATCRKGLAKITKRTGKRSTGR